MAFAFSFIHEAACHVLIHIFFKKKIVFHIPGKVIQNLLHGADLDADKFFFPHACLVLKAVYGLGARLLVKLEPFRAVNEALNVTELSRTGNALACIVSIGAACVVYLVLVLALRILSRDDLALMPKGEKIGKILHIQ